MHRDPELLYPSCASDADIANNFINFFGTKISKIRNDIESHSVQQSMQFTDTSLMRPLLKKPSLDHQEYKNFRPIFNLPSMSKVIEKVMAKQLADYINDKNLSEVLQSAYQSNYSTEIALIRVYNDIALSIDNRRSVILVLLDLSVALDTVDHTLLCSRLPIRFDI